MELTAHVFLENKEQHIDFLPRAQVRKMGGVYHRDVYLRVASKGGNALLIHQIHRKLLFQKSSKNQKFRTEKISDLAEFRRINIRTETNPKSLGVNVFKIKIQLFLKYNNSVFLDSSPP